MNTADKRIDWLTKELNKAYTNAQFEYMILVTENGVEIVTKK